MKRKHKKNKKADIHDGRIDLEDIIKVDNLSLNNVYDQKAVLYMLNKKNKLNLTMDDVVFDTFDSHKALLRAKNKEKYRGRKVIYYEQSKNVGFIIWLIISLVILFLSISVLLPVGLVGDSTVDLPWHEAGQTILIACGPVAGGSFISIMICILCWRGEVTLGQMSKVESKAEQKQKQSQDLDAEIEQEAASEFKEEYSKKTS